MTPRPAHDLALGKYRLSSGRKNFYVKKGRGGRRKHEYDKNGERLTPVQLVCQCLKAPSSDVFSLCFDMANNLNPEKFYSLWDLAKKYKTTPNNPKLNEIYGLWQLDGLITEQQYQAARRYLQLRYTSLIACDAPIPKGSSYEPRVDMGSAFYSRNEDESKIKWADRILKEYNAAMIVMVNSPYISPYSMQDFERSVLLNDMSVRFSEDLYSILHDLAVHFGFEGK